MNIFELNTVATPAVGLIGGVTAVKGLPALSMVAAGGIGLVTGIGVFFAILGLMALTMKVTDKKPEAKRSNLMGTIGGLIFVAAMLGMPFVAWRSADLMVKLIFG